MAVPLLEPLHKEQCVIVDVFLPKKLVNQARLIELLTNTLDFEGAHLELCNDIDTLYGLYPKLPAPDDRGELRVSDNGGADEKAMSKEEFGARVGQMRRRIAGYSIFEVDGAFEPKGLQKSSVIRLEKSSIASKAPAGLAGPMKQAFKRRSSDFAQYLGKSGVLHLHPSMPDADTHRILVGDKARHEVVREKTVYHCTRCVTVIEERVLMIRFISMPDDEDRKIHDDPIAPVLWDTLMLVGCYFARALGKTMEDEIWITYDVSSTLWRWQQHKGEGLPIEATRSRP